MEKIREGRFAVSVGQTKLTGRATFEQRFEGSVKERTVRPSADEQSRPREGKCSSPKAGTWSTARPVQSRGQSDRAGTAGMVTGHEVTYQD